MKQTKSVKLNEIEKIKETLAGLPEKKKEDLGLREAISAMKMEIKSALDRGYSLEEILRIIGETNQTVGGASVATVRQYMRQDIANSKSAKKLTKPKKIKSDKEETMKKVQTNLSPTSSEAKSRTSAAFETP